MVAFDPILKIASPVDASVSSDVSITTPLANF
ncbi:unnamed protein product [Cuscuta epithymum]|uniref:Uncharacterized protein n=1 Tax=Cuscuta epithymum TaxID=186058 RepID=A0AAV0G4K2_9ASTE|nr:unnamed protein product [Cuscuta epithymum]